MRWLLQRRLISWIGVPVAIAAAVLAGCATGQYLKTEEASPSGVSGTYTLILYGGRYAADLQNVAILDREGDPYTFEMYAPAFDYTIMRGVPAGQAAGESEKFVRSHYAARHSQWKKILASDGSVTGYEVRPLYDPLETGYPDILDITYVTSKMKVIVRISFKPEIERGMLREERDGFIFKGER